MQPYLKSLEVFKLLIPNPSNLNFLNWKKVEYLISVSNNSRFLDHKTRCFWFSYCLATYLIQGRREYPPLRILSECLLVGDGKKRPPPAVCEKWCTAPILKPPKVPQEVFVVCFVLHLFLFTFDRVTNELTLFETIKRLTSL